MNRVLFKAAAIVNIAAAALIYVACSGDDGKDGPPGPAGASCVGAPSATVAGGIDISCGGVPAGTLQPGTAGAPGAPGQNGQGVPADGCYLSSVAGGYNVICGGVDQGALTTGGGGAGGGCSIAELADSYEFTCGNSKYILAKAVCNYPDPVSGLPVVEYYDPKNGVCDPANGLARNCDGKGFDYENQFCSVASLAGEVGPTILARCGAAYVKTRDGLSDSVDSKNKKIVKPDSTGEYDPRAQFCLRTATNAQLLASPSTPLTIFTTELEDITNLVGAVTPLCDPTVDGGHFTAADFCASGKVYARCAATAANATSLYVSFDPATQFCQAVTAAGFPTDSSAAPVAVDQIPTKIAANGTVKPRCGTQSFSTLAGWGQGTYGPNQFCSPLASKVAAGTNAKLYDKCLVQTATGTSIYSVKALSTGTAANFAALGNYEIGEYDASINFCNIEAVATSAVITGVEAKRGTLVACGTGRVDPTKQKCIGGVPQPYCGLTGSVLEPISGTPAGTQYDVTKKFCDVRGQKLPTAAAANSGFATKPKDTIRIEGGKLYDYVSRGGRTWTQQDILLGDGTHTAPLIANQTRFSWAQATSVTTPVCPEGWRLSTDADWDALATAAGAAAGQNLRDALATGQWTLMLPESADSVFRAKPGAFVASPTTSNSLFAANSADKAKLCGLVNGTINNDGDCMNGAADLFGATNTTAGKFNVWWTSGEANTNNGNVRYIKDSEVALGSDSFNKAQSSFSVRCVKN